MREKEFDLIIFGASGFTGQLVVEYLFQKYGVHDQLRWAIAGRDQKKLESINGEIGNDLIPILVADVNDASSLDEMCQQAKVLCSTVGPYSKYGSDVVAACVRNDTHYCDLSGEVPWMKRMIGQFHEIAKEKKLRIVHSCGFDSIPSDMGVYFLQNKARNIEGKYCYEIRTGVKAAKGGLSGGTFASLKEVLKEAENDKEVYEILTDPYALNPKDQIPEAAEKDFRTVEFDQLFDSWKCPFIMASVNTRIVRRGIALRRHPYGKAFKYNEFTLTGQGWSGRIKAYAYSIPLAIMMKSRPGSWIYKLIDRFTPAPGEGPSRDQRESGFWIFDMIGKLSENDYLEVRIKGDRDPGYGSTSKMLSEAAVCLAKDDLPGRFGSLTPSVAMGDHLLVRLRENAGVNFRVKNIK